MTDYRLKCCVSITRVNYRRLSRKLFGRFGPTGTPEKVAKQRTAEAQGGERCVLSALPPTVEDAKKISDVVALNQATEYYKTDRGITHTNATTDSLVSVGSAALACDAFSYADVLMRKLFLAVVGDVPGKFGASRDALEIYGRGGSKEKKLVVFARYFALTCCMISLRLFSLR